VTEKGEKAGVNWVVLVFGRGSWGDERAQNRRKYVGGRKLEVCEGHLARISRRRK